MTLSIFTYPNDSGTGYIDSDYYGTSTTGWLGRMNELVDGDYKAWAGTSPTATAAEFATATGEFHKAIDDQSELDNMSMYDIWYYPIVTIDSEQILANCSSVNVNDTPGVDLSPSEFNISSETGNGLVDGDLVKLDGFDGSMSNYNGQSFFYKDAGGGIANLYGNSDLSTSPLFIPAGIADVPIEFVYPTAYDSTDDAVQVKLSMGGNGSLYDNFSIDFADADDATKPYQSMLHDGPGGTYQLYIDHISDDTFKLYTDSGMTTPLTYATFLTTYGTTTARGALDTTLSRASLPYYNITAGGAISGVRYFDATVGAANPDTTQGLIKDSGVRNLTQNSIIDYNTDADNNYLEIEKILVAPFNDAQRMDYPGKGYYKHPVKDINSTTPHVPINWNPNNMIPATIVGGTQPTDLTTHTFNIYDRDLATSTSVDFDSTAFELDSLDVVSTTANVRPANGGQAVDTPLNSFDTFTTNTGAPEIRTFGVASYKVNDNNITTFYYDESYSTSIPLIKGLLDILQTNSGGLYVDVNYVHKTTGVSTTKSVILQPWGEEAAFVGFTDTTTNGDDVQIKFEDGSSGTAPNSYNGIEGRELPGPDQVTMNYDNFKTINCKVIGGDAYEGLQDGSPQNAMGLQDIFSDFQWVPKNIPSQDGQSTIQSGYFITNDYTFNFHMRYTSTLDPISLITSFSDFEKVGPDSDDTLSSGVSITLGRGVETVDGVSNAYNTIPNTFAHFDKIKTGTIIQYPDAVGNTIRAVIQLQDESNSTTERRFKVNQIDTSPLGNSYIWQGPTVSGNFVLPDQFVVTTNLENFYSVQSVDTYWAKPAFYNITGGAGVNKSPRVVFQGVTDINLVDSGKVTSLEGGVTTADVGTSITPVDSTTGQLLLNNPNNRNHFAKDLEVINFGNTVYLQRTGASTYVNNPELSTDYYPIDRAKTRTFSTIGPTVNITSNSSGYLTGVTLNDVGRMPEGKKMLTFQTVADTYTPPALTLAEQEDVFDTDDEWASDGFNTNKNWPTHVTPQSANVVYNSPTIVNTSSSGIKYTRSLGHTKWQLEVTYPPMDIDDFKKFHAVAQAAHGQSTPFYFILRNKDNTNILWGDTYSTGTTKTLRFREPASAGDTLLTIDGLTSNVSAFERGEVFIDGENENGALHTALNTVDSNIYGETKIRTPWPLRNSVAAGDKLYKNPYHAVVTLAEDNFNYSVDQNNYYYVTVMFDLDNWK